MVRVFFEKATKYFGRVRAVEDLTLEVKSGELMVLLGPSGCGKTTTLRLVAGLERLTRGKIYIDDEVVDDASSTFVPPRYRGVSMVFQSYALFPHLSVFDNIAFPLVIAKVPKNVIRKRVYELAEMLGIKELLNRKPRQLSGGQQQRVALARALISEPKILLLDEPLANLDAKLRVSARIMIKKIQRQFKCTTIYVTHDQSEAMAISDRIAVMKDGKIQQVGSPEELYHKPINTFVADFIGNPSMNLIECTFDSANGILDFGAFKFKLPRVYVEALKDYKEVIFGIRPEHIIVSKEPREGNEYIEFRVYAMEKYGYRNIVILEKEGIQITVVTHPTFDIDVGSKVWIGFDPKRIRIYDKKTGKLLV